MPRLPKLDEAKLSPEQRKTYDEIKRLRGQVRGPFAPETDYLVCATVARIEDRT